MQVPLQLPPPPGILSRLARAFQGNSFTPSASRRSVTVAGGAGEPRHDHRCVARSNGGRVSTNQKRPSATSTRVAGQGGAAGWLRRHQPEMQVVGRCIGEVGAGGGMPGWSGSHTRNNHSSHIPHLKVAQGLELAKKRDFPCLIFADSALPLENLNPF